MQSYTTTGLSPLKLVWLVNLLFLGLFALGCNDPMILMNDSEKAMWRYQSGISNREADLLQVKHLSRDLEICAQKTKYASLSEQQIQKIVMQDNQEIHHHLIKQLPSCRGITNHLFEKLEDAYETGNRRKQLYRAILDGQASLSLR